MAFKAVGKFDGRTALVGKGIDIGRVENIGRIGMIVVVPVGDRAQGRAGGENIGRPEQRHQRHEAAVGAAVNARAAGVGVVFLNQPVYAVNQILQLGFAHVAVNGGAPVAAVAGAGAKVHVAHVVAEIGRAHV